MGLKAKNKFNSINDEFVNLDITKEELDFYERINDILNNK